MSERAANRAKRSRIWDRWFDAQYDLSQKLDELFADATRGRSSAFKAATASAIVEHFAETTRFHIELPAEDLLPGATLPADYPEPTEGTETR